MAMNMEEINRRSLWMGELEPWMDDNFIRQIFTSFGEVVNNVKVIRDKITGMMAGYCFVEFTNPMSAAHMLQLNGQLIPGTNRLFRLNWASGGGPGTRDESPEYSVFVGDLTPDVNEYYLMMAFSARYPSVKGTKVVMDPMTGSHKGYGFVRFSDENDYQRALVEMQGTVIGGRPIRVSVAAPKNKALQAAMPMAPPPPPVPIMPTMPLRDNSTAVTMAANDPNNTTVFIGGIPPTFTDDDLRAHFGHFGDTVYVRIPPGRTCGFIQFTNRQSAEQCINAMNGCVLGGQRIKVAWGRNVQRLSASGGPAGPGAPMYGGMPPPMAGMPGLPSMPMGMPPPMMPEGMMMNPNPMMMPALPIEVDQGLSVESQNENFVRQRAALFEEMEEAQWTLDRYIAI